MSKENFDSLNRKPANFDQILNRLSQELEKKFLEKIEDPNAVEVLEIWEVQPKDYVETELGWLEVRHVKRYGKNSEYECFYGCYVTGEHLSSMSAAYPKVDGKESQENTVRRALRLK